MKSYNALYFVNRLGCVIFKASQISSLKLVDYAFHKLDQAIACWTACIQSLGTDTLSSIIAVHGLNPKGKDTTKHAWDTWREPAGEKSALWLRDTLPPKAPKARIFLYGYDASAALSNSQVTFIDKANELLESIRVKREDHPDRPLILTGHSMGGILIEQALINAQANRDYNEIYNAAYAFPALGSYSLLTLTPQGCPCIFCYSSRWRW